MSSPNPSDPRLLLPEWLRDGDLPASIKTSAPPKPIAPVTPVETTPIVVPVVPYSDRLSLDTRLDPAQLVSATDLPKWLGGLAQIAPSVGTNPTRSNDIEELRSPTKSAVEQEPDEDLDSTQAGAVDVQINGWMMVAGAVGLLILVLAALKLYFS